MAIDYSGLLTGVSQDPKAQAAEMLAQSAIAQDPNILAGAKYALSQAPRREAAMRQAVGGLLGRDLRSPAEKAAQELQKLTTSPNFDINNPEDLAKMVRLQQAMGNPTGAAQTATRIRAIKQADIEETRAKAAETRAVAAEIRAQERYEMGKIDRLSQIERQKLADEISKEQLAMSKAREARAVAAAEKALSVEERRNAQQGELRALYVNEAIDKGKPELAEKIRMGMDLATAGTLLTKTSTAQIKPVTGDEKEAYDKILYTPAMQKLLPKALKKGWHKGPLSDATETAIFLKTKEIATREQLKIEVAMVKAIDALVKLYDVPPDEEGTDKEKRRKVDSRGRPLPDKTPSPQADDAFDYI